MKNDVLKVMKRVRSFAWDVVHFSIVASPMLAKTQHVLDSLPLTVSRAYWPTIPDLEV